MSYESKATIYPSRGRAIVVDFLDTSRPIESQRADLARFENFLSRTCERVTQRRNLHNARTANLNVEGLVNHDRIGPDHSGLMAQRDTQSTDMSVMPILFKGSGVRALRAAALVAGTIALMASTVAPPDSNPFDKAAGLEYASAAAHLVHDRAPDQIEHVDAVLSGTPTDMTAFDDIKTLAGVLAEHVTPHELNLLISQDARASNPQAPSRKVPAL